MGNAEGAAAAASAKARTEVHRCKFRLDRELAKLKELEGRQVVELRTAASQPRLLRARARELVLTRDHMLRLEGLKNQVTRLGVSRVTVEATASILASIQAITEQINNSGLSWESSRAALSKFAVANQDLDKASMLIESSMDEVSGGTDELDDVDAACAQVLDEFGLSAAAQLPDAPQGRPVERAATRNLELKSHEDP